jgi:hypothetical protein
MAAGTTGRATAAGATAAGATAAGATAAGATAAGATGSVGSRPGLSPAAQSPSGPPPPPGLREQLDITKAAARGLIGAHVELAKAELGDVMRAAVPGGLALAALLLAGLLLPVGLSLFFGEWIFGSIGWGVLHGTLVLIDVAVLAGLLVVASAGGTAIDFGLAVLIAVVVGVVLGLDLTNRGWTSLGDQVAGNVSPDIRPLVVAMGSLGVIGAILGFLSGLRRGLGTALGGAVGGAIAGVLLGVLTAIALGPRVGAAVGVTVGLIAWPALIGLRVARRGIDGEAFKARFWPEATIETTMETIEWTKETIEWVRHRMLLGRGS